MLATALLSRLSTRLSPSVSVLSSLSESSDRRWLDLNDLIRKLDSLYYNEITSLPFAVEKKLAMMPQPTVCMMLLIHI